MYEYKLDLYQNILTVVILLVSYLIIIAVSARNKKDLPIITILFLWHTLFCLIYYKISLTAPSDAKGYFAVSLYKDNLRFYPGTSFLQYLTSLFTKSFFEPNYLNTALIFNTLSSSGLILLYLSLKECLKVLPRHWYLILFIPSLSFWTASLSKDSLSFFSISLIIYAISSKENKLILILLATSIMFMVRPHVAAIVLISFVIYFVVQSKINLIFKLLTIPLILIGLVLSLSFVKEYVGLEDSSLESIDNYLGKKQGLGEDYGSYVDISSMSLPMKLFTYNYRPLPYEARSMTTFISSLENVILLFLTIFILIKSRSHLKLFIKGYNLLLLIYLFLVWIMLANVTNNLGIASRQKWMYMPVFIYLLIYIYSIKSLSKKKI